MGCCSARCKEGSEGEASERTGLLSDSSRVTSARYRASGKGKAKVSTSRADGRNIQPLGIQELDQLLARGSLVISDADDDRRHIDESLMRLARVLGRDAEFTAPFTPESAEEMLRNCIQRLSDDAHSKQASLLAIAKSNSVVLSVVNMSDTLPPEMCRQLDAHEGVQKALDDVISRAAGRRKELSKLISDLDEKGKRISELATSSGLGMTAKLKAPRRLAASRQQLGQFMDALDEQVAEAETIFRIFQSTAQEIADTVVGN